MGTRRQGRIHTLSALYAWEMNKVDPARLLSFAWLDEKARQDKAALAFAAIHISGTLKHIEQIDDIINSCLDHWSFNRVYRVDLALLRISTYAMLYQDQIPQSVTINEAVELAKRYSVVDSFRFINGILDKVAQLIVTDQTTDQNRGVTQKPK